MNDLTTNSNKIYNLLSSDSTISVKIVTTNSEIKEKQIETVVVMK